MNKVYKLLISIILAMLFLVNTKTVFAFELSDSSELDFCYQLYNQLVEIKANKNMCTLSTRELKESAGCIKHGILVSSLKNNNEYSVWYGGSYLDDYMNYVINVVGENDVMINYCQSLFDFENVIIQNAKYSYQELEETIELIQNKIQRVYNKETKYSSRYLEFINRITSISIDERKNKISIGVKILNEQKDFDRFREFFDNDVNMDQIEFRMGEDLILASTMKAGDGIKIRMADGSKAGYSMGYRAYRINGGTTEYGFVTAAHNGVAVGRTVYDASDSVIGTVSAISYVGYGYTDASFIKTHSTVSLSNSISNSPSHVLAAGIYNNPGVNTTITVGSTFYKSGVSGFSTGTIASVSEQHPGADNMYIQDTVAVSGLSAIPGDSGGTGYIRINGYSYLVGILRGYTQAGAIAFVKAYRIAQQAGWYPY